MLTLKKINSVKKGLAAVDNQLPIVLGALGDPGRFRIFKILLNHHDICVTDIAAILDITVSAASQQLRVLERVGLVVRIRMGQMVCYEINRENPITKQLLKLLTNN